MDTESAERQRTRKKHRILASLGEGGMAKVYLSIARGPAGFSKLLVIKAIKEDLARDPEVLAMFLDEARLAARLSHPNVVQTLEVDELGGYPVIVMEYLQGQPLSKLLFDPACRAITLPMKLRILAAALEGLHYIHEVVDFDGAPLGLVHRDVSPQNIVVTYDGQVKVLDFGIAKGLISIATTQTDAIKGKIRYMAPEQMCGESVDRRADVFSAGVILWEILTGNRIWQGRSQVNVMNVVLNDGVPSPRSVDPSVPAALNAICVKALAREPADRYRTAGDLLAAIEGVLASTGAPVLPKEVGKVLGDVFAESRARTQALVNRELKKVDRDEGTLEPTSFPTGLGEARGDGSDAGATKTLAPEELRATSPVRRRRAGIALAAAVALGVLGVLVAGSRIFVSPAALSPGAQSRAIDALTPPVPARSRELAAALATASSSEPAPTSSARAAVSAGPEAAPEAPRDRGVVRSSPAPKRAASRAEPAPAPTIAAAAPLASTAPSASPSSNPSHCSPPFYFDAQRIKRLKPECF